MKALLIAPETRQRIVEHLEHLQADHAGDECEEKWLDEGPQDCAAAQAADAGWTLCDVCQLAADIAFLKSPTFVKEAPVVVAGGCTVRVASSRDSAVSEYCNVLGKPVEGGFDCGGHKADTDAYCSACGIQAVNHPRVRFYACPRNRRLCEVCMVSPFGLVGRHGHADSPEPTVKELYGAITRGVALVLNEIRGGKTK